MEIDPKACVLDVSGQARNHWLARLPKDATADDLKTPVIWAKVQTSRHPLRRWDEVLCVGFDESFAVSAIVVDATATGATLEIVKLLKGKSRELPLFNDGVYGIRWDGTGFSVYRLADDKRISGPHGSEALAVRELRHRYPVAVA